MSLVLFLQNIPILVVKFTQSISKMKSVKLFFCILSLIIFSSLAAEASATVDREAGRIVSTQCALCHGPGGEGNGLPKSCLACIDTKTFLKFIHEYQQGARKNYMMLKIWSPITRVSKDVKKGKM